MTLHTKELAPAMKIMGGVSGVVILLEMIKGQAFKDASSIFAYAGLAACGFVALRGVDQMLYGRNA